MITVGSTTGTPEPLRPFNLESHRLIPELEPDFDQPVEIVHGGSLVVAMNEEEIEIIKPFFDELRQMGIECKLLEVPEAHRFEPLLNPKVAAAVHNPINYHVNPFLLCAGYMGAAMRREAKTIYGIRVREVQVQEDRIVRVVTDQDDYQADWVVVAGGAYTPQILSNIDIDIPIVPARGQAIITEACAPLTNHTLMFQNHLYVQQTASGNFFLGSHTEFVGFENRITIEKITAYARMLAQNVPILSRLKALRFFAGFRPIIADDLPIIGPVPNCSRLIIASGHGRTGIRYSASTGKAVSELIVDGKTELPIDAFSVGRVAKQTGH
jgi:sarcosine oxidase subunit beta